MVEAVEEEAALVAHISEHQIIETILETFVHDAKQAPSQ
jgi:hypothetical protein